MTILIVKYYTPHILLITKNTSLHGISVMCYVKDITMKVFQNTVPQ